MEESVVRILIMMILTIGDKVLMKYNPSIWLYPFATNLEVYLSIAMSTSILI